MNVNNLLVLLIITTIIVLVTWLIARQKKYTFIRPKIITSTTAQVIAPPTGRLFVFDITVVDPVSFVSRQLKAKLLLKNVELFLNPSPINSISTQRSFISPPDEGLIRKNTQIHYLGIEQDTLDYNIDSLDELPQHFYEIKNKFFLTDPFLTSGKDMVITDKMKTDFSTIVDKKSAQSDIIYQNYKKSQV